MTYTPRPIDFCDRVGGDCAVDETVTVTDLRSNSDRVAELARRPGGVEVVVENRGSFRLVIPSDELRDDVEFDEGAVAALEEAERRGISADVAVRLALAEAERDAALDALSGLLSAFPRLRREFSTAEQQTALRRAERVLRDIPHETEER